MKRFVNPVRRFKWCVRFHSRYVFFNPHTWRGFLSYGVKVVLMAILAVSFTLPAYAQEKLWNELNDKATTLYQQGKYSEAINVAKESLKVAEEIFGSDHPNSVTTMNSLAWFYYSQGKYAEAEPLLKRALEISEKALGKEHPQIATVLSNLAALYKEQGKYTEAEPLYNQALEI
ncbi:MAG: kinesin light chain KLC [Candidatus Scalindua rubra]|uniref:Kinesin light chain KLC n=1 Tax=Candidatus Scalindua rubra TaxID=1872076 RepID=A0A1E3XGN8_9BACT|nr:MAG: kinesin light chain KLC [Candidatus Scalindua rubra]